MSLLAIPERHPKSSSPSKAYLCALRSFNVVLYTECCCWIVRFEDLSARCAGGKELDEYANGQSSGQDHDRDPASPGKLDRDFTDSPPAIQVLCTRLPCLCGSCIACQSKPSLCGMPA